MPNTVATSHNIAVPGSGTAETVAALPLPLPLPPSL